MGRLTMAEAHKLLAAVCGELCLCLVRGAGSRTKLKGWARRIRAVADAFEEQADR